MHTLIAEKIGSCLKERLIIFDRAGPPKLAGTCRLGNRIFPGISPPRLALADPGRALKTTHQTVYRNEPG